MRFAPRMTDFLPTNPEQKVEINEPFFITMPLDHFSNTSLNGTSTFQNRYWINATYYEPGGPVFLFDSGEQNAAPLLPYYLQEFHGLSATMRLAKRYKGIAILWEHRYYGKSMPFPVNAETTPEQWQFLTTEQALEDVIFFANSFSNDTLNSSSIDTSDPLSLPLHPSTVPWIWLGGSYPGVRGAFLRVRNPEVIFATWASSAPVHAQVDMASYYKAAERSLTRNCSADWVAVTKHVDTVLQGSNETLATETKFRLLKARLSGPGGNTTGADGLTMEQANSTSNVNAAGILMDPLNFYQYYGFAASLLPFCNLLETRNFTAEPLEGGVVSSAEGQQGIDQTFDAFLVALAELDYDSIPSQDDPATDRAWMRQYCSEYGFYQRGDPNNPLSIETSFLSLNLFQQQCNETFADHLPTWPQVGNLNKYGGWEMNVSNVLFTNGEFDPWRTMGLASIEPESPHREPSVSVPACNAAPPYPSFFGLTHSNMVHVSDMRVLLVPDSNHSNFQTVGFYSPISQEPFYSGLGLFQLALDEWLPCFGNNQTVF
ncbi:peptidase S28 [Dendrothele bispora CBS 962.96]|uniref:Peptidase S28 n=1 Tax=Dendrothele bispora (strain CBS 962.96) TaxID=1314807 RepID=A0A4S8LVQ2_DENBC|nr:peptidase S28 [Dendrothele bispora CBS 962.96]